MPPHSPQHATDLLLVEDNPADKFLTLLALATCSPQPRVWAVDNGGDALAFLRKDPPFRNMPSPTLVLLDLNLPGLKGSEVLTELRHLPAYQRTPVIVVSTSPRVQEEPRCRQLGANGYVEKDFDFERYTASLQTVMHDWLGVECPPS